MLIQLDLHVHSKYSFDSLMEPKTIIKVAQKKGLNCVAVTDHNTIKGGTTTENFSHGKIAVIVGSELQTDQGDIIGLFLDDEVRGHGALEVIDEIKNQGGLAILPHPFRDRELNNAILKELFGRVDAIEALNSRIPVRKQMTEHSKKAGKPLVAGSDAHFPCEIGLCRTIIRVENNSLEEIRKAILTKDIKIIGKQGPPYLHSLSAIIRNIKTKKYRKLPASIAVLARDYSRALISPLLCNLQGFI